MKIIPWYLVPRCGIAWSEWSSQGRLLLGSAKSESWSKKWRALMEAIQPTAWFPAPIIPHENAQKNRKHQHSSSQSCNRAALSHVQHHHMGMSYQNGSPWKALHIPPRKNMLVHGMVHNGHSLYHHVSICWGNALQALALDKHPWNPIFPLLMVQNTNYDNGEKSCSGKIYRQFNNLTFLLAMVY